MAELVVRVADLAAVPVPRMCARSGGHASRNAKLTVSKTPPWVLLTLLLGFVPFVVVALLTQRKVEVHLPHAPGRAVRRRVAFYGAVVLGMALPFLLMGVYFEPGATSSVVLAAGSAALAGCVWAYRDAMVRGRWVDLETVKLAGLHPAFATALADGIERRRAALAARAQPGWYPDPSGQHALRWFDGMQWTTYVEGVAGESVRPRAAYG